MKNANPCMRLIAWEEASGRSCLNGMPGKFGKEILLKSGKSDLSGQSWSFGSPRTFKTVQICSMSLSPGNRGDELIISPNIHPIAHRSTPSSYFLALNNNSGALYHRVATWWLYGRFLLPSNTLARPKSAIFSTPVELIRRLAGLRSLCIILMLWQKAIPFSNITIYLLTWDGVNGFW